MTKRDPIHQIEAPSGSFDISFRIEKLKKSDVFRRHGRRITYRVSRISIVPEDPFPYGSEPRKRIDYMTGNMYFTSNGDCVHMDLKWTFSQETFMDLWDVLSYSTNQIREWEGKPHNGNPMPRLGNR